MNVGGHRLTNEELRCHFVAIGFAEARDVPRERQRRVRRRASDRRWTITEQHRDRARGAARLRGADVRPQRTPRSGRSPRRPAVRGASGVRAAAGKLQVSLLARQPDARPCASEVLALASERGRARVRRARAVLAAERRRLLDTALDMRRIERAARGEHDAHEGHDRADRAQALRLSAVDADAPVSLRIGCSGQRGRNDQMVEPLPRGRNPFDESGVQRDADGVARYVERPRSLVAMLRASVERDAAATAVLEVGGPSLSATASCGSAPRASPAGCADAGVAARRSRGDPPGQRDRLGAGVLRRAAARRGGGAGQHALHRGGGRLRRRGLGRDATRSRRARALPDGDPVAGEDLAPRGPRGDLLHERHDRLPEGRDDLPRELPDQQRERVSLPVRSSAREGPSISTLVSVPLFHVTGCNSQLIPMLELGGRVEILSGPLDLDGFFQAVGAHGVNQLVSVPAIYHALMRHPSFARARREPRALGLLRRRADRREPRAPDQGGVSRTRAWATASASPRPPR